jgi:flavin reductase (DIM6/NTAB) family NADH-FMN oxidoreductase RutF
MITTSLVDETPVDEASFRAALRHFASGVTVITTREPDGTIHGLTATAFCSLSLDPPLVLVAVARNTRGHRRLLASGSFGVNILHIGQTDLSKHFGGRPSPDLSPAFSSLAEVPVLAEAKVKLACRLREPVNGGDHSIFVGLVIGAEIGEGAPLLHYDGRYHRILIGNEP